MAHKIKELGTDQRRNYVRNLGWKLTSEGQRVQPRFYLGKAPDEALRRNARLQELWGVIESEAESPQVALWTDTTLQIAKAVSPVVSQPSRVQRLHRPDRFGRDAEKPGPRLAQPHHDRTANAAIPLDRMGVALRAALGELQGRPQSRIQEPEVRSQMMTVPG